jgi:hypothetical protein
VKIAAINESATSSLLLDAKWLVLLDFAPSFS